jgi:predicted ferric reductase
MDTTWSTLDWTIARAGGFTALLLLTLAVAAGLAMSIQWQSPVKWPRLINNELHNFLTLLSTVFVALHVLTIWIDPFTHFNWYEVFIPFTTSYRPIWTAFGIIALYLGIAIGITTLLRPQIGYRWWRRLHVFTLLIYGIVIIHGITSGSDTTTWWGVALYVICILLVCPFLVMRVFKFVRPQNKKSQPQAKPVPGQPLARRPLPGQPLPNRPASGRRR